MIYYAIWHKPSGRFLPQTNRKAGFTHDDPVPAAACPPRLFKRRQDAKRALTHWLAGEQEQITRQSYDGEIDVSIEVKERPDRKPEEMEIVEVMFLWRRGNDSGWQPGAWK